MGMAASQGRLLMMTARISNNEFEQQCVAYSKQRLADDSQQANDQYLEALNATQYQVIVGYNGDTAQYEAVSYNVLTGFNNVASSKQYIVSDNTGKIVVTKAIADAFENASHNYNTFLETVEASKGNYFTQVPENDITEGMVHDAWDNYLVSINKGHSNGIYADEGSRHIIGFSFNSGTAGGKEVDYVTYNTATTTGKAGNTIYLNSTNNDTGEYYYNNFKVNVESFIDGDGVTQFGAYFYATETPQQDTEKIYLDDILVTPNGSGGYSFTNLDGSSLGVIPDANGNIYVSQGDSNDFIYDRKLVGDATTKVTPSTEVDMSGAGKTFTKNTTVLYYEGTTAEQRQLYDYAMALSKKYATQYNTSAKKLTYDADKIQYYKNIFDQMTTKGYTTYDKMIDNKYINTEASDETTPFASDEWLIRNIKNGKFVISYYSANDNDFIKTTLDDDESIVNKENKSKMAIAEQVYQNHMDRIEAEDKRFDMQLTKLESEHTALLTEYDSVAKVISKNVEKSFGIFNA